MVVDRTNAPGLPDIPSPNEFPTAPMPSRVLASPSTVCHRVCKAAEFFRYAVSGTMLSPSEPLPGCLAALQAVHVKRPC